MQADAVPSEGVQAQELHQGVVPGGAVQAQGPLRHHGLRAAVRQRKTKRPPCVQPPRDAEWQARCTKPPRQGRRTAWALQRARRAAWQAEPQADVGASAWQARQSHGAALRLQRRRGRTEAIRRVEPGSPQKADAQPATAGSDPAAGLVMASAASTAASTAPPAASPAPA